MPQAMKKEKWNALKSKGVLQETEQKKANDWVKVHREGSDTKYGTLMYSASLQLLRHVTIMEFYDGGIVD